MSEFQSALDKLMSYTSEDLDRMSAAVDKCMELFKSFEAAGVSMEDLEALAAGKKKLVDLN